MTIVVPAKPQRPIVVEGPPSQTITVTGGRSLPAGGAAGQVLAKATSGDFVTEWTSLKTLNGSTILGSGDLVVSASVSWGGLTGTLSDQTDLQAALDGKQPLATVLTNTTASFTTAQESKLAGIASGATANATDAQLRDRATHTGTQAASTITGLAAVATSGSASDLGAGTLPAARFNDTAHGARAGGTLHAEATTSVAGFMSGADKTKLDGIASGAQVNVPTDLSYTASTRLLASSTGADVTLPLVSSGDAGLAPASGGGTTNFLRADGTWAAPPGGGGGVSDGDKGDITVASSGTVWTVDAAAITLAKMADLATSTIIGRAAAGTGVPEALTASQVRTIINVADGATANASDASLRDRATHTGTQAASTITGLAAVATSGSATDLGAGTLPAARLPAFGSGDVSFAASGGAGTIANNAVSFAKMADIATDTLIGRDTAASGDPEAITVTGGIEFSGAGSIRTSAFTGDVTKTAGGTALTIANDAVTNAKMANMATATIKGRTTAGTGDPEDLTPAQARSVIEVPKITVGTTAPSSPSVGDVWIDTN